VTDDEIDYILGAIKLVFPGIEVNRSHIVFRFTGVRPLPSSSASTAGQISRDHSIQEVPPGGGLNFPIYSLVGGKWTTFRAFSEQTADKVLAALNLPRKLSTAQRPIGGGKDYPKIDADKKAWLLDLRAKTEIELDRLQKLFDRYGTYAAEVAAFISKGDDAMLAHTPGYSRREVMFITQREKVAHLDDFLLRRSLLAMLGKVNADSLAEFGMVIGEVLGWPPDKMEEEARRTAEILMVRHGMKLKPV
jgi:glycerol-3-phosphate dehydrogenase